MITTKKHKEGYTLLVAALIGSFLLSISLSILTLSEKEIRLAVATRDSQLAFYAADIGIECAIYWDIQYGGGTSAFAENNVSVLPSVDDGVDCSGNDIVNGWVLDRAVTSATTTFFLDLGVLGEDNDLCAVITVSKTNDGANTKIESRGRNSCDTSNTRRVERAIRVTY